jgi:hypothetical protein
VRPRARLATALAAALLVLGSLSVRGDSDEMVVALYVSGPVEPGVAPEAMPPRFALMEDGTAYVGGTSAVAVRRLEKREIKDIEKDIDRIRKIPGLATRVDLGPGSDRSYRIVVRQGKPLDLTAVGDTGTASPAFSPIVSLIVRLADVSGREMPPYSPTSYLLSAREETLAGGCRRWTFPAPLAQVLAAPQVVAASAADSWPTGGTLASVCDGGKHYSVSLKPLLPGEQP